MSASSKPISGAELPHPPRLWIRGQREKLGLPAAGALPILGAAGVMTTGAVALWLTLGSLPWPLVHDAPLMHYVAARLLEGAAPYRDLFDMNFPGVYLVHVLGLALFGGGDAGFRALDLALLVAAVAGLGVALAPLGPSASVSAGVLFWLYHVAGGAWRAGQRDFILCVPLAWMTAAALSHLRTGRLRELSLAGLSLGAAVWIKPHALLLLPLLGGLAWTRPMRRRALAWLAAGVIAPAVPVLAWLAATGALPAFLSIVVGYLPLYGRLGRTALVGAVAGQDLGWPVLAGLGTWAAGGLVALWRSGRIDSRAAMLVSGVAYGGLHFALQGKGWEYHLYPLALFAVALGAAGFGVALASGQRRVLAALLIGLLATTAVLAAKGRRNLDADWIREKVGRAHAVAAALAPVRTAGRTVQVLDTTEGGIHALYLLGAYQPTRFLYDFPFYHDVEHPYVRALRAELLDGLRARPPAAVVLFERGWPRGGYARLDGFPALAAWLEAGYTRVREGDGYRIYAARGDR